MGSVAKPFTKWVQTHCFTDNSAKVLVHFQVLMLNMNSPQPKQEGKVVLPPPGPAEPRDRQRAGPHGADPSVNRPPPPSVASRGGPTWTF